MDVFQKIQQHIEATKRQIIYENELVYFMKRYGFYDMIDLDSYKTATYNDQRPKYIFIDVLPIIIVLVFGTKGNRTVMIRINNIRFTFGSSFG